MLESKWFEKKITNGMIYFPKKLQDKLEIKGNDKIAVIVRLKNQEITFPARISQYFGNYCSFRIFELYKKFLKIDEDYKMKVIKLDNFETKSNSKKFINLNPFDINADKFSLSRWINLDEAVLWHEQIGQKGRPQEPVIINKKIALKNEFLKYLGLYFAEGNNTEYYRIYASTKELAILVIENYERILKNSRLSIKVCFTKPVHDSRSKNDVKNFLINYWSKSILPYKIKDVIFNEPRSEFKGPREKAEFGTLMITDTRMIVRHLHQWLIKEILSKENITNYKNFFEGAADGDISVHFDSKSNAFSCIEIATNKSESKIWEHICDILNLKYKKYWKSGESEVIQIRGYMNFIKFLKEGLFKEYPKRYQKLKTGLKNRIETYLLCSLLNSPTYSARIEGKFALKIAYLLACKGGDLTKNKLIRISNKMIVLTDKGKNFIKELNTMGLIEE